MTPTTIPTPCFCTSIRSSRMRRISASDGAAAADVVCVAALALHHKRQAKPRHRRLNASLPPAGIQVNPDTRVLANAILHPRITPIYDSPAGLIAQIGRCHSLNIPRRHTLKVVQCILCEIQTSRVALRKIDPVCPESVGGYGGL